MLADELRRAVEVSPRVELPKVSALLWKAYAAGHVTEDQAKDLSAMIEARRALPAPQRPAQRRSGSRPRSTCPHGASPPVGRIWRTTAGPGRPVPPRRTSRARCRRGGAPQARRLSPEP